MIKIAEFTMLNYPIHVETTKTRRKQYYEQKDSDKLPQKYKNNKYGYEYNKKLKKIILVHVLLNEPIVKNINLINKPRIKKISGQSLHELSLQPYERSQILTTLKTYFLNELSKHIIVIKDSDLPIRVKLEYETNRNELEDLDNYNLFYQKVLCDCFVKTRIIRNKNKLTNVISFDKIENKYGFLNDDNVDNIDSFTITFKKIKTNNINIHRKLTIKLFKHDTSN